MKTLEFHLLLTGSRPAIHRRFVVQDSYRMDRLHQVIQIVMGWDNSHLHEFMLSDSDRPIGMLDPHESDGTIDETTVYLRDLALKKGSKLIYRYDFGDRWEHELTVKEVHPASDDLICLEGEGACPPEDCGGIAEYNHLVEKFDFLNNPDLDQLESFEEWLGDMFDPEHFSLRTVNRELQWFKYWHQANPEAKSGPWHQV